MQSGLPVINDEWDAICYLADRNIGVAYQDNGVEDTVFIPEKDLPRDILYVIDTLVEEFKFRVKYLRYRPVPAIISDYVRSGAIDVNDRPNKAV